VINFEYIVRKIVIVEHCWCSEDNRLGFGFVDYQKYCCLTILQGMTNHCWVVLHIRLFCSICSVYRCWYRRHIEDWC